MKFIDDAVGPQLAELIERFAASVMLSRGPSQTIGRSHGIYIKRWYLGRRVHIPVYRDLEDLTDLLGHARSELENIYIHEYCRPDVDEPHDHPWWNVTYVVRGWMRESTFGIGKHGPILDGPELVGEHVHKRGAVVVRDAKEVHAITATSPDLVTLFATGPKTREWGFHTARGWVPWQDHRPEGSNA